MKDGEVEEVEEVPSARPTEDKWSVASTRRTIC